MILGFGPRFSTCASWPQRLGWGLTNLELKPNSS
ncbi:uncharacterized protein PRCAT00002023001 [Priceomyces carsonii]|nr:unnamed protein product [Priceomyces carsonii]